MIIIVYLVTILAFINITDKYVHIYLIKNSVLKFELKVNNSIYRVIYFFKSYGISFCRLNIKKDYTVMKIMIITSRRMRYISNICNK